MPFHRFFFNGSPLKNFDDSPSPMEEFIDYLSNDNLASNDPTVSEVLELICKNTIFAGLSQRQIFNEL